MAKNVDLSKNQQFEIKTDQKRKPLEIGEGYKKINPLACKGIYVNLKIPLTRGLFYL